MEKGNQKQRGRRRRWKLTSGLLAGLLAFALMLGLVPGGITEVYAAGKEVDSVTQGTYEDILGSSTSTRSDGGVWADKSVSAESITFDNVGEDGRVTVTNDSDFLVTYSMLAASSQVDGQSTVPTDVVFIVDLSGSMSNEDSGMDDGRSRIAHVVDALNTSIETLMTSNPESRIAVVGYSSTATTLLPLDHYTKATNLWGEEQDYFTLDTDEPNRNYADLTVQAVNSRENDVERTIEVSGGTNVQMGVYQGMNILATETATTATAGSQVVSRVPSVVLMSDGAATFSSDSISWWNPVNNSDDGPGSDAYYGNGMKAMMTAAYMKEAIDRNYEPSSEEYAVKVYTIGIGTADLTDEDERNLANITLNPSGHWNDNNTMANAIRNAWSGTSTGSVWVGGDRQGYAQNYSDPGYITNNNTGTPRIAVDSETHGRWPSVTTDVVYELTHPERYDINEVGLQYNDAYYDALTSQDINNIFKSIVNSINVSRPKVPTEVTSDTPSEDGYITYTDTTGQYMEIKDVKTLIWSNQVFTNPEKGTDSNENTTYTFTGEVDSPAYGAQNVSQIVITVTDNNDHTQTIEVKVPASVIPLRVNTVSTDTDGTIESNSSNNALPLRLCYTVGLEEELDPDTLDGVDSSYIEANTENGEVNFYSNAYTSAVVDEDGAVTTPESIGAYVTFTPAADNSFFYFQENVQLYTNEACTDEAAGDSFNENNTYYFQIEYYDGDNIRTETIECSGAEIAEYVDYNRVDTGETTGFPFYSPIYENQWHIKAGSPRFQYSTENKGANPTETANTYREPVYGGDDITIYLGNNGKLQKDAPASLIIAKNVTADEGLTAPVGTFTFQITSSEKAGETVKAIITTPGTGGSGSTTSESDVKFDGSGVATVTLTAGQSIELKGMAGADYSIVETNLPSGFAVSGITGAEIVDNTTHTASGTVVAGAGDETVTFTNNYSVSSTTTDKLNIDLGGTKTIDKRDFQDGDKFTFEITAAEGTPLPTNKNVTIEPASGKQTTFEFGEITFTKPGTYVYTIKETPGDTTTGIGYDSAEYTVTVRIKDNGQGQLVQDGDVTITKKENSSASPVTADEIVFENTYTASDTTAAIQGTKVLKVTNSDRTLTDGMFTFKIEKLGCTSDGGETFVPDETQPMPTVTTVSNVGGNVAFGEMRFTQDMVGKTYGYKITEVLPEEVSSGNLTLDGITYDNSEKTVLITVSDNGSGQVIAAVTPNSAQESQSPINFTFTNSYEPEKITIGGDSTNAGITVQKTFTGRDWTKDDGFEYQIAAVSNTAGIGEDNMPMPEEETVTVNAPQSGESNTNAFGAMTFEKAGEYVYTISEVLPEGVSADNPTANGITYDTHTVTVTVKVEENTTTGKLSASVTYNNSEGSESDQSVDNAAAFTNTYAASNATYSTLTVTKELTGGRAEQLGAGEFDFAVTLKSGDSSGIIFAESASNNADGTVSLGNITFTKAGSYMLQIKEVIPDDAVNPNVESGTINYGSATPEQKAQSGWTKDNIVYDNHTVEVTFNVTDNKKGQLTVAEPTISGEPTFTNKYQASGTLDGSANLKVTKNLVGRAWEEGDSFTFSLAGHGQTTLDAIANGTVDLPSPATVEIDSTRPNYQAAFGNITFKAPGDYEFSITESSGDIDGLAYDTAAKIVKVSVKDIGDGVLKAEVKEGKNPAITNTYTWGVLDGSENLKVSKTLSGRDWESGDSFTFTLAGGDDATKEAIDSENVIMPGSTEVVITNETTDHAAAFGNIIFKEAGTYKFVIKEQPSGLQGVKDDTDNERMVTVTVTQQQDRTLRAEVAAGSESLAFTNEYSATGVLDGAANLKVTKVLTGRPWNETDEFTFTLSAADDTTTAAVEAGTVELPDNADGLTISATDVKDGSYTKAFGNITFNKYGDYSFEIAEKIPDSITADENGVYKHNGIQYDTRRITVDVSVIDNKDGTLTATATQSEPLTFTNVYSTSDAEVTINGTKTLKVLNGSGTDIDGKFTFEITGVDEDGNPAPLPDETQVTNIGNSIPFGTIKYTMENVFGDSDTEEAVDNTEDTEENLPEDPSADTGAGDEETLPDAGEAPEEGNNPPSADTPSEDNTEENGAETDGAPGTDDSTAPGTDDSTTPGADDSTTSGTDGSGSLPENVDGDSAGSNTSGPEEEPGTVEEPADVDASDNAESETVPNSALELLVSTGNGQDPENEGDGVTDGSTAERSKTFTYTVTELPQNENNPIPGVTNDTNSTRTFTVTVTDDGKGNLTAVCSETGTTKFEFVNTYEADPEESSPTADGSLVLTKVLNGRDLKEGEFTFRMTGISDNAKDMSLEARNNADGTVSFGNLTFTDDGEYRFAITETNNQLGGVAYDTTSYFAVANVTDNTDGTLSVAWTFKAADGTEISEAVFTNSYKAAAANVTLKAEKLLDGRTINAGEFAFELKDESGTVLYRVVNAADGTVQFPQMTFENAGTYKYTISEQKGSLEGITYDQTVYNVVITVTDDGNGQLNAAVNTEGKDVVFRNVYKAPSSDNGGGSSSGGSGSSSSSGSSVQVSSAQTGDDTNIVLPIVGICASVAVIGICVAVVYSRRKKTE